MADAQQTSTAKLIASTKFQLAFRMTDEQIARVPEEFKALTNARLIRNTCYVDYEIPDMQIYSIPELDLQVMRDLGVEVTPMIIAREYGQFSTRDQFGYGQTVCGGSGRALPAFWVCDEVGQNHAYFSVKKAAIICTASKKPDHRWMLKVWEVKFDANVELNTIQIDVRMFWSGSRFNEAPRRYQTAMAFAMAKATTVNCSGPAWYLPRESKKEDVEEIDETNDANVSDGVE